MEKNTYKIIVLAIIIGTLLIYIGGKDNTIEEVNRTLKVLAHVIKEYLEGINGES